MALLFDLYAMTLGLQRFRHPAHAITWLPLALALAMGSGKLMRDDLLED